MPSLSPFVYWAQNENRIFLKVDLKDSKEPEIDIEEKSINFSATGTGAQGLQKYNFSLQLFEKINSKESNIRANDNSVNVTLVKVEEGWWPRLISTPQKPSWLKIDFDKWQSEDDFIEDKVNDVRDDYPDIYKRLMQNEIGYLKEDFKKVYMVFYNFAMLCAFMYAFIVLVITIVKEEDRLEWPNKVYPAVGHIICFIQLLQALEIMHPIFGYVKGSPFMPCLQILGRLLILYGNLEFEPRLQKMPVVAAMFLVWTLSDVIRYIYYILNMAGSQNATRYIYPFFKWLRYSAWIILYPIGFLCEMVIVFRNIIYLLANPRGSLTLPNRFNFTFDYLTFLRIYFLLGMIPGMYTLLKHMYRARAKQLGGREPFDKINIFKKDK